MYRVLENFKTSKRRTYSVNISCCRLKFNLPKFIFCILQNMSLEIMICNNDNLRSIYFAYFHSIASYGTIFWGNSSYSRKIFTLQKKIIIIMMGAHPRTSCRKLFKKLEISAIPSQYIYSLMSFFNWKSR